MGLSVQVPPEAVIRSQGWIHKIACDREIACDLALFAPAVNTVEALIACLLLIVFQCGGVARLFHCGDELAGVSFAFVDLHHSLVRMGDFGADHSRGFFKCGPHFFNAINLSDHARNRQVHSFLCLRFGGLEVACGRDVKRPKGVSCCQHRH